MSMQMPLELQQEIRQLDGNNHCADCGTLKPQWGSLSMGSLVCLNCSGQHRALGVHLSFVRSVTMDSWSDKQIRAMRAGGNKKMNDFLLKHGVPKMKATQIREKYDNDVAEHYREIIEAARDNKPGPTTPVPPYNGKSSDTNNNQADDFEGLTAEERFARHKKLEEEARERMRAKFGKTGGLGSGSFGSAGIGSDPNYNPNGNKPKNSAGDWFAKAAQVTGQWSNKVNQDIKKANVGEKLKSGWSWFTNSATQVIEKAKANIAKDANGSDSPPRLYQRDSPTSADAGSPLRLYNPDAAKTAPKAQMTGFGVTSSTVTKPSSSTTLKHGKSGFGSSSVTSSAPTTNTNNANSGWMDEVDLDFGTDDEEEADAGKNQAPDNKAIEEMDDSELLLDIDGVLGGDGAEAKAQATPNAANSTNDGFGDDDDFFKEFDM